MKYWNSSLAVLALFFSTLGAEAAIAVTETPSESTLPLELAQDRNRGECRRANASIFIYRDRSPERPIATLQANEEVRLAESEPIGGWIAVNEPVRGFVEARFLTQCSSDSTDVERPLPPLINSRLCVNRRPNSNTGLPIHSEANSGSRILDRVFRGEEVTLANVYVLESRTGQLWLRITRPIPGWVDYGDLEDGDINFTPCVLQRS